MPAPTAVTSAATAAATMSRATRSECEPMRGPGGTNRPACATGDGGEDGARRVRLLPAAKAARERSEMAIGSRIRLRAAAAGLALALPAAAAQAQLFVTDPVYPTGPIAGNDPLVGLPLPGATPAEYRAHLLWNLRSGLNVAALQCQFSPYLRTVDTYNALINQHARELAAAYTALQTYFRRVGGRNGAGNFDRYSTQTYNNFSTLQA